MVDVVIAVAEKVAELLVVPIRKHILYPFKYKSSMEELTKQVEKLTDQRDMVQHSVDEAKRQGDEIEKKVEKWLKSVDEFTKGVVKPIIDDQVKAGKLCSIGFCPNLMARYSLSRKAAKTTEKGVHLLGEGTFEKVSYRPLLQKTTSIYVRGYEDFDSRNRVFNDLMKALTEAKFNLIGVYGMGGVGKTTLVKRVVAQAIQDKLFDDVVMVEVTATPDIKNIQGQIADKLGLTFQEESLSGRADRLHDRLKKEKRLLLVLDNIWAKLDLEAVGIPLGQADQKGRNDEQRQGKILFTSRNLHVLRDGMNTQKNFFIEILSVEEAEKLFWKIVGHTEEKPDLNPIAVEIVERCDGLPVAIATIASALKNKSLSVWKNALDQLRTSNPRNIEGMHANVYSAIELSYNFLEREEAKSLFLLCGLMAASGLIRNHELFKYAIGWGLFQDVITMEQGRNKLHTLIDSLKASCLLLENDYGHSSQIKMHDIIHAVAVSIASTEKLMFNIRTATRLKEMLEENLPRDATAVSLPYVQEDICELPERLELPKLKLLYLCKKDLNLIQISDTFFEEVKELKVLNLTNFYLTSLPSSLQLLTNLQTLCLCHCALGDIASIGYLTKLEVLSLAISEIEQLPEQIRQLTRLRYLDMSNCRKLKTITPGVISSLTRLEELYIGASFAQWDVNGRTNASLTELKQLAHLTALEIHILDVHILPQDLFSRKLDRYIIIIGDVWGKFGNYLQTSKTLIQKWSKIIFLGNGIKTLLNITEDLYLEGLKGVKNILYELDEEGFPQLKHLHVQNGLEVQDIINSDRLGPSTFFPKLESLFLRNLINLEKICNGQLARESFSKLRIVKVEKCDRLKHLFSFSMAKNLLQLEEIEVIYCKKLEEVVFNNSDKQFHQNGRVNRTEFTRLRTLRLQCLPQLTSFGSNAFTPEIGSQEILAEDELGGFMPSFSKNVLLPNLEKLKLSSINIECLWLDQLSAMSSCCQTLTSLTLEECSGNLKFLFSYSMVKSLVQLQKLKVRNCKSIEGVINSEELRGEGIVIKMVFPNLLNLQLKGLPKLARFGFGNSVEFLSLTQISIEDCPKLKTFFSGSKYEDIKKSKEVEEMNFQDDIHVLFDEKVELPTLASLNLSSIASQTIWHNQLQALSACFHNLTMLTIDGCDNLKCLFPISVAESLNHLEALGIWKCKLMEWVVMAQGERKSSTLLPKLKQLILDDLPELTIFCNFNGDSIELPSLSELSIEDCPKMKTFASNSLPGIEEPEEVNTDTESHLPSFFDEKVSFSYLKKLRLRSLPELLHLWKKNSQPRKVFENLAYLEVLHCSNLKTLVPSSVSLQNLDTLKVRNCDGLISLVTFSTAKSLEQLKRMEIIDCKLIEEIIIDTGDEIKDVIVFNQLEYLKLQNLPNLTSFCKGNFTIEFPYLQRVLVIKCLKMMNFSQGVLSTPKLKSLQMKERLFRIFEESFSEEDGLFRNFEESFSEEDEGIFEESFSEEDGLFRNFEESFSEEDEGCWEGDLNTTVQKLFRDMVGFHDIENFSVSNFPHLKELWHEKLLASYFSNLKSLMVDDKYCSLRYIFTPSLALGLAQLQDLEVKNCVILEVITVIGEETISNTMFPNLNSLKLINLSNFTCFFNFAGNSIELPSLTQLSIENCPNMDTFISYFLGIEN